MGRTLWHVPILHAEADLGSLATLSREASGAGPVAWARKQAALNAFWSRVEAWTRSLPARLDGWLLYQDGLPECGREREIVSELAAKGSANHRILLGLERRGARLVGTESPELLVEEYRLARADLAAAAGGGVTGPDHSTRASTLLARRDEAIGARVAQTLPEHGTGILFVGALHSVQDHLPDDIVVRPAPVGVGRVG